MLSFRRGGSLVAALVLGAACGGSSFSSAPGDGGGGGGDGSVGVGAGGADATADGSSSGGGGGDASTDGGASDGSPGVQEGGPDGVAPKDAMADAPALPCPDVRGSYTIAIAPGSLGCGNLNATAPECIRQTTCDIEFRSNVSGGGPAGITGTAPFQNDGVFDSAALTEGTAQRSGCTGSWNATTSTLTVVCGGQGTPQSCVVNLVRSGPAGIVACN